LDAAKADCLLGVYVFGGVRVTSKTAITLVLVSLCLAQLAQANGAYRLLMPKKKDASRGTPSLYHLPAEFRHIHHTSCYVKLDDGTKLAVDVYLPDRKSEAEKLPVMLEQTRYWRLISLKFPLSAIYPRQLSLYRQEFVSHGYAWVAVDSRGAGASFGYRPWEFSPVEIDDSRQIIDWIVRQAWCNGKVGTIGHSFSGNVAEFTLLTKHPALKAAAVLSSPFDLYANVLRPGGMSLQPFISEWIDLTAHFDRNQFPANLKAISYVVKGISPVQEDRHQVLLKQAMKEHRFNADLNTLDKIVFRDDYIFNLSDAAPPEHREVFDRDVRLLNERFPEGLKHAGVEPVSPTTYVKEIDEFQVPMYFSAGWLDGGNASAAVSRFLNYTMPGKKLILGPWDHDFFNISPFTRPGLSAFRIDREMLKFFDQYLKPGIHKVPKDKAVHYFTLGEEKWHASDTWPPSSGSSLNYLGAEHRLTTDAPTGAGCDQYRINFNATTKSGRWDCMLGNPILQPYPNRKKEDKLLLTYDGQPLAANKRITGQPMARLFLTANADDCALFVYLEDVAPDGFVRYVTEGELLCGNRTSSNDQAAIKTLMPPHTFAKADYHPLSKGEVVEVKIGMLPMSYLFKKGHRIRLSIAGADRDHFKPPKFAKLGDTLEILWGDAHPSSLTLPEDTNQS
jgi:putative CocE/NonD family hydrolase